MKVRIIRTTLAVCLLSLCSIFAKAAEYPTLYVVGGFQDWSLPDAMQVRADADGVYSFNMTVSRDNNTFKMSFSGNDDWNVFDRKSFGIGTQNEWSTGIHGITEQISNSKLPAGNWTITVYYNHWQIALDAQGSTPTPPAEVKLTSGTLPVLYINVTNEDGSYNNEVIDYNLSHKNYFDGTYWLDTNGCEWLEALGAESIGSKDNQLKLQIKARGNYTRTGFSKKPFKLKLDKKQSLLGLSKSKHFAILAHADDTYGFLRNFVGFELGKRIGLPWTPSQQPVEVVINGDYRGLYFLTESIRIDEDRINIREGQDNETDKEYISGGYIVELDNYDEDDSAQIRMEEKHCARDPHNYDMLRITFDTPEVYSDMQRRFITDQFTAMNNAVGSCNTSDVLWTYMDIDDAARYYLVKEIISDTESYHGSTYLFRDHGEGQKWHFSPLWDCGNAFNGSAQKYFYDNDPFGNTWIPSMRENAKFNDKIKATWLWFMSNNYDGITDDMDEYIEHIRTAADLDYKKWKANNIPQKSNNHSDIDACLRNAKDHLRDKTQWLSGQFGNYTGNVFSEPERDSTPAAPLPDYAQTGVEDVQVARPLPQTFYNLTGQPVTKPVPGNLYITESGVIRF